MSAEEIPNILYKYYSPARWDDTFIKGVIRFSPFAELNDPFEGMPAFKKIHSHASREKFRQINRSMNKTFFRNLERGEAAEEVMMRLQQAHKIGVFCLTPKAGNMLMWAHYTDSHRGFVVGFNMRSDFFRFEKYSGQWCPRKVNYLENRHIIKNLSDITREELEAMIYTKAKCWDYEKEYRMLCELNCCSQVSSNNKIIRGFHTVPPSAISCVIFGASMDEKIIEKNCNELAMQNGCSHIKKRKAALNPKSYSLQIKNIR